MADRTAPLQTIYAKDVVHSCKSVQPFSRNQQFSIARLPELIQNVIRSSHGHSTPSLKISCKSVQPFSRNVADKEISIAASRGLPELAQKSDLRKSLHTDDGRRTIV